MNNQHPITPPPELVGQWLTEAADLQLLTPSNLTHLATQAARWGADQELDACCKWLECNYNYPGANPLRVARRPKPPTLNSIALQMLSTIERDAHYLTEITDTIRRALEQLP